MTSSPSIPRRTSTPRIASRSPRVLLPLLCLTSTLPLVAAPIALADPATPTPSASPTPTPSQSPAAAPSGSPTPSDTATPTPSIAPTPSQTATPGASQPAGTAARVAPSASASTSSSPSMTPSATPAATPEISVAASANRITAATSLPVCSDQRVMGTAAPGTKITLDGAHNGHWLNTVARAKADANGRWSAVVQHAECYPGKHAVRARAGSAISNTVSYTRTGSRPGYTITATQPSHTGGGFYDGWGGVRVTGRISAPTTTPISLWRMSADRRTATKIVSTTTDARGNYSFSIGVPSANSYLFVDSGLGAGAQRSALAKVFRSRASISLSIPAVIDATNSGYASGSTVPATSGNVRVVVQVLRGGKWVQVVQGAAKGGKYRLNFTDYNFADTPGTYQVRSGLLQSHGGWVWSPTRTVNRTPGLKVVVRPTTSADVAKTYRAGCPVGPGGLHTIQMNYLGYDGRMHRGEMVVRKDLSDNVVAAFSRGTTTGRFPIRSMKNPNVWNGDDVKMMAAGNTSAFNCRRVTGNPYAMSPHAYGKAIDVNTIENPYRDPNGRWYPSSTYATSRPAGVKGLLLPSSGLVVGLRGQGYEWFTGWDWQHFEAK